MDPAESVPSERDFDERLRVLGLEPTLRDARDYCGRARWLFCSDSGDDRYVEVTRSPRSSDYLVVCRDGVSSSCGVFQVAEKSSGASAVKTLDHLVMEVARHLDDLRSRGRKCHV